jgi:hypothetical protein
MDPINPLKFFGYYEYARYVPPCLTALKSLYFAQTVFLYIPRDS